MRAFLILHVWLMLTCLPASAAETDPSGLDLLERCQVMRQTTDPDDAEQARMSGYCTGYLVGFVSGFAARDVTGAGGRFCPPPDARLADFADALQAWLADNPGGLEGSGAVAALRAFLARFLCPEEIRREAGDAADGAAPAPGQ